MRLFLARTGWGRLLAATALVAPSLLMPPLMAGPARAQAPGEIAPSRVGRLARIDGAVSAHGAGGTAWTAAVINTPLSDGDAVWTQPGSDAWIDLSGDSIVLSEQTELDLATVAEQQFSATAPQGELFLDLRNAPATEAYAITTPRGVVGLQPGGAYDIVAGTGTTPTLVAVVAGTARIQSGSFSLAVSAGQTATVTGSDALQGSIGPMLHDAFLAARLARPAPVPVGPPQIRYMTGATTLASYGSWQAQPDYGQVWYPQVPANWAPYREGSWSYVQPWGWTWVDAEPWGFAPFHYGRWSQFGGRWGWVPSEPGAPPISYEQPAYAPALVDFVAAGAAAGVLAGAAVAALDHGPGGGSVGWIPLGPREAYQPPFHVGPTYMQRVNYGRIDNVHINRTVINNTTIINNYANRNALTVVPAAAMANSQPVRTVARIGPDAFGPAGAHGSDLHLVQTAMPVRPVADTRGLTPVAARALGLGPIARPAAPGPQIDPALFHPHSLPQSRTPFRVAGAMQPGARPELPDAGGRPGPDARSDAFAPGAPPPGSPAADAHAVRPGEGVRPGGPAPGAQPPRQGLPPLRAQGAVPPGMPAPARDDAHRAGAPPGMSPVGPDRRPDGQPVPNAITPHEGMRAGPHLDVRAMAPHQAPPSAQAMRPDVRAPAAQPPGMQHPGMQRPEPPRMPPPHQEAPRTEAPRFPAPPPRETPRPDVRPEPRPEPRPQFHPEARPAPPPGPQRPPPHEGRPNDHPHG